MNNYINKLKGGKWLLAVSLVGILVVSIVVALAVLAQKDKSRVIKEPLITNITDTGFTVTWTSDDKYAGEVVYKDANSNWLPVLAQLGQKSASDDRDLELNKDGDYVEVKGGAKKRYTHHVSVRNLKPETEYRIRIKGYVNGTDVGYKTVKTTSVSEDLKTPDPVYGKVEGANNADAFIVISSKPTEVSEIRLSSAPLSGSGTYSLDANQLGVKDLTPADITAQVYTEKLRASGFTFTGETYKPLQTIVISGATSQGVRLNKELLNHVSAAVDGTLCTANSDCDSGICDAPCVTGTINEGKKYCVGLTLTSTQTCGGATTPTPAKTEYEKCTEDAVRNSQTVTANCSCGVQTVNYCLYQYKYGQSCTQICANVGGGPVATYTPSAPVGDTSNPRLCKNVDGTPAGQCPVDTHCVNTTPGDGKISCTCNTGGKTQEFSSFSGYQEYPMYCSAEAANAATAAAVVATSETQETRIASATAAGDNNALCKAKNDTATSTAKWKALPSCSPTLSDGGKTYGFSVEGGAIKAGVSCCKYSNPVADIPLPPLTQAQSAAEACAIRYKSDISSSNLYNPYPQGGICSGASAGEVTYNNAVYNCCIKTNEGSATCPSIDANGAKHQYTLGCMFCGQFNADSLHPETSYAYVHNLVMGGEVCGEPPLDFSTNKCTKSTDGTKNIPTGVHETKDECISGTASQLISVLGKVKAAETTTSMSATETGRYAFFKDGERVAEKNIVVGTDGKVTIKLYVDTNKNGKKDATEEYITDYASYSLAKEASAVSLTLNTGWNLINLPLVDTAKTGAITSAAELMDDWNKEDGIDIKHIARYRDGQFQLFTKRESGTTYSNDFDLIPGEALFVFNTGASTEVTFGGNAFTESVGLDLVNGWNMVGVIAPGKTLNSENVIDGINKSGMVADTCTQYDSGLYQSVIKEKGTLYGNNFNIVDTKGYFVRVKSGGGQTYKP